MSDTTLEDRQLSAIMQLNTNGEELASELDPNYRPYPIKPPYTGDDELDSGIAGPDIPEIDNDFSRPSQGLDGEDDPLFSQMPLPEDFTARVLTDTSVCQFAPWELLAQCPYLIGMALRTCIKLGRDMAEDTRYQLLHDTKVYLEKALEVYDPSKAPYLFTELGYIKGTVIGGFYMGLGKGALVHALNVRMAFARHNRLIAAFFDPVDDTKTPACWGIKVANIKQLLTAVTENMDAIIKGRNREEVNRSDWAQIEQTN